MIPETISAIDNQLVHLTHLSAPIETSFVEWLRENGFIVHTSFIFDSPAMPLHYGTVYQRRDVQMPWFSLDAGLRKELMVAGANLEQTRPTDVMFLFQGGQKGRQQGGIYVYKNFGPLVVSTSTDNAESNLRAVLTAYKNDYYSETEFEKAANMALGIRITERSRIPMGIISLPGDDDTWTPVAWYFPDSQSVMSMDGQLLPHNAGDGKTRAAVAWPNLGFS